MGKKRIIEDGKLKAAGKPAAQGQSKEAGVAGVDLGKLPKKRVSSGVVNIKATYNNTLINFAEKNGNVLMWVTSGGVGFKGAKKGTPFAASKAASLLADKAKAIGVNEVDVVINGVGAGREAAVRAFIAKGISVSMMRDVTPVPHNGPKPPKPRRV